MEKANILVVDERGNITDSLLEIISRGAFQDKTEVNSFPDLAQAVTFLNNNTVKLIITDFQIYTTQQICEWVEEHGLNIPIIVITDIINVTELRRFLTHGVNTIFKRTASLNAEFSNKLNELLFIDG